MRFPFFKYLALVFTMYWTCTAIGNNLIVTNTAIVVYHPQDGLAQIRFDLSWNNSWRYTNINHDAAWVFFKMRAEGATDWIHVKLAGSGINPPGSSMGVGTGIEMIVPDDGIGVFVRRSGEGVGRLSVTNARVAWDFVATGLTRFSKAQVQTLAMEMVFVSSGNFRVGDGSSVMNGQFEAALSGAPFLVTNEAYAITLGGGSAGSLGNNNAAGMFAADDFNDATSKTLPATYPKGYASFYCMKYEITQGQYTDFLNMLTPPQANNRYSAASTGGRYTIGVNVQGVYTNDASDRACNFLAWTDSAAYADWSGLRPMSEMEFEKACRGPLSPVADEFAWGSADVLAIVQQTGHLPVGADGSGTEIATPANANCNYSSVIQGPVRAGIYATSIATRQLAGASYWGIMELSGNLFEKLVVGVGNTTGRLFTGLMGDGTLTATGAANVSGWPASSSGAGFYGGSWQHGIAFVRVSDRCYATRSENAPREHVGGGRGVRTAPAGVGP